MKCNVETCDGERVPGDVLCAPHVRARDQWSEKMRALATPTMKESTMPMSPALDKSLSHAVPTPEKIPRIEALRAAAKVLGAAIEEHVGPPNVDPLVGERSPGARKPTRERSLAITHLEESLMWAVKGIVLE